jgi:predicted adenylyl cyclase CyaB
MPIKNIEIKARCADTARIREILKSHQAEYKGLDHQVDTYFKVNKGRLKLREGTIEKNLIFYYRANQKGPKKSSVNLYPVQDSQVLKELLANAMGILAIVDKYREIYFIENIKFHIDKVAGLGGFLEIEAIDQDGSISEEKLLEQCQTYLSLFGIREDDLLKESYSDMIIAAQS